VTLEEIGHPQPPTPIQTDNSTVLGFANNTIKQKRFKAIDMRLYWIKDRVHQKQFLIYWRPGPKNLGDYHTKHHSPSNHQKMRQTYLLHAAIQQANVMRGCVKPHTGPHTGLTGYTGFTNDRTMTTANNGQTTHSHTTNRAMLSLDCRRSLI
jgi:hypothetical protein